MVPAARHRQPRQQLVLQFEAVLEVPGPRIVPVGVQRDGPERRAQVGKVDLAARRQVDAADPRAVDDLTGALSHVVAVHIRPGQRLRRRRERIVIPGDAGGPRQVVLVHRVLDRRLGIAEEVVHHREARRPITLPIRQIGDLGKLARLDEPADRRAALRDLGVQTLPAQAGVDGQPLDRPGVLPEHAQVLVEQLAVGDRRVPHDDRRPASERHARAAVVHATLVVLVEIAVGVHRVVEVAPRPLEAHFDVVRPGHIRPRRVDGVAQRTLSGLAERRILTLEARDVGLVTGDIGEPGRREARLLDAGLVGVRVVLGVVRVAALEQQPAGDRRGDLGCRRVIRG